MHYIKVLFRVILLFPLTYLHTFKLKKVFYSKENSEEDKYIKLTKIKSDYSLIFIKRLNLDIIVHGDLPENNRSLFILNHRSLLDIPIFESVMTSQNKKGLWIAKKSLTKIIVLGDFFKFSSNIFVDLKDKSKLKSFFKEVKQKCTNINDINIIMFPEGTRNKTDEILEFQGGVNFIAKQNKLNIVPIYIDDKLENVFKESPYFKEKRKVHIYIGEQFYNLSNIEEKYKKFVNNSKNNKN